MFVQRTSAHVPAVLALAARCTTALAPSMTRSAAARSVTSARTNSSPSPAASGGGWTSTSRKRYAERSNGRSAVPIRPAPPVITTSFFADMHRTLR